MTRTAVVPPPTSVPDVTLEVLPLVEGHERDESPPSPAAVARIESVVRTMEQIEADARDQGPLGDHDGLACFDYLYTIITKNVLRCIAGTDLAAGDPRFHDPEFMAVFDLAFANRYLDGIGRGSRHSGQHSWQPTCWKVLLDHREDWYISPLTFAVAGINAHINFDLPFAVVTACTAAGREPDSGTVHEDYLLTNEIFAEHMQQLRQHFEDRFDRGFDRAWVSKGENMLGNLVVVVARALAWNKATQLWRVRNDEVAMTRLAKSRDRKVALVNLALFELDRIPSTAFRVMHLVPGPTRTMANRGLARTGWKAGPRPARHH